MEPATHNNRSIGALYTESYFWAAVIILSVDAVIPQFIYHSDVSTSDHLLITRGGRMCCSEADNFGPDGGFADANYDCNRRLAGVRPAKSAILRLVRSRV
jgi:hypothetical protein